MSPKQHTPARVAKIKQRMPRDPQPLRADNRNQVITRPLAVTALVAVILLGLSVLSLAVGN